MSIQAQSPLPLATLSTLAPAQLVSHRMQRSIGTRLSVALAEFAPADQTIIMELYHALNELFSALETSRGDAAASQSAIQAFVRASAGTG